MACRQCTGLTPIRDGEEGAVVSVVFPASRDVAWFNAPKLTVGEEAVFITHKPEADNKEFMQAPGVAALLKERPAEVVSEPFDVLPVSDEPRVRALAAKGGLSMRLQQIRIVALASLVATSVAPAAAQTRLVNMVPNSRSGETNQELGADDHGRSAQSQSLGGIRLHVGQFDRGADGHGDCADLRINRRWLDLVARLYRTK